jgi:hypothetical protein
VGGDRQDHDGEPATTASVPPVEQPDAGSFRRQGSFLIRESLPEVESTRILPEPSGELDLPARDETVSADPPAAIDAVEAESTGTPARARPTEPGERDVRVVGPRFLPDPEEAIDLRARDPHRAR